MDLSSFKQKFIDEAYTLLTNLDNSLIDLEQGPGNKQSIDEVFRVMHTIKGASGMYGFDKVVEITHELETLYDWVRENNSTVPQQLFEVTFATVDHIRTLLTSDNCLDDACIRQHGIIMETFGIIKKKLKLSDNTKEMFVPIEAKSTGFTSWSILFYPNDELIKRAINLTYTFHDLFQLGEYKIYNKPFSSENNQYWSIFLVTNRPYDEIEEALMFIMDYCKITKLADFNIFESSEFDKRDQAIESMVEGIHTNAGKTATPDNPFKVMAAPDDKSASPIAFKHNTNHISVSSAKLDTLMYLVSELVTAKSELIIALGRKNEEKAFDTAEKIEKLSKLFSENALSIRLVSLHEMVNRFKRLVRDLAKQLNKSINFVTIGEDTEFDKNIIDNIGEPIMHLIRNCIDHGIESPEKREALGKPATGTIKFEAITSGNQIYLTISDDGNGIDPDCVYKKAVEKGFIAAGTELSQEAILNLIFLPGFSTAQSLSNVSGRGVGMDIVLRKIQEIRGEISISSQKGKGTSFILKLQQSISIIDTLLIKSGETTYAVPVGDIESCILEGSDNLFDKHKKLIVYNKSLIPFINISDLLDNNYSTQHSGSGKLVVIARQNKKYALVVDNIIGEFQAVIKPLGIAFNKIKFLSGASIMGDGSIALLLDADKLWNELTNT